ncbi:MAG TPA: hypothetical protein PLJ60_05085 [Chryseolinea sp.]|nr:hypothetical protein [Chryseolinea sp.]HPH45624.1 hypothetical protein [Chryseolinea sp.]HPM29693.1 hypothetical protein [Chryseolinea sp.]
MKTSTFSKISLLAIFATLFVQIGAQLFAMLTIVQTLVKNPPKSFQMVKGDYGYDSSIFWNTIPNLTTLLFVIALIACWKTKARKWIIISFSIFICAGVLAMVVVEPKFAELITNESSTTLNEMTSTRYRLDWTLWFLTLLSGLVLTKPIYDRLN